ncbi:hypothetical protein HZU73_06620 [Apis mellifera caucasica]|nr:hypothetical protein HZU73_06620 [Apis mellifera caucasica]KAG9436253.1 hypothetical protein HZU67_02677 [Apis mellifera carnica]
MIGSRSLIVLLYKLFIKEYSFDPDMIEIEEERNKERFNILDELLGTLSMTGLIYSLYCCHGYYILGVCVVTSLSIFNVIKLYYMIKQLEEMETSRFYNTLQQTKTISKFNVFNWVIVGGCFAYVVGNNYAIVANYPLLLANWAMVPEGFYQGWTINRAINDYLMATYIMCMTEALRQTSTL